MKDFTSPVYIEPIINEIGLNFTPNKDNYILKSLNCSVLLEGKNRNCYAVRAGQPFYIFTDKVKSLYKEVEDYAEYASTYSNELDEWRYNEEERIQTAIRDRLIEAFT